jgi:hypothetical protein
VLPFSSRESRQRLLARRALALVAAAGTSIGAGCLLLPDTASRLAGLPDDSSVRWLLRLFGIRDLLLGLSLERSRRSDDGRAATLLAGITGLSQLGDLTVSLAAAQRGSIPRRLAVGVALGALPTLAATVLIRRGYSAG